MHLRNKTSDYFQFHRIRSIQFAEEFTVYILHALLVVWKLQEDQSDQDASRLQNEKNVKKTGLIHNIKRQKKIKFDNIELS